MFRTRSVPMKATVVGALMLFLAAAPVVAQHDDPGAYRGGAGAEGD